MAPRTRGRSYDDLDDWSPEEVPAAGGSVPAAKPATAAKPKLTAAETRKKQAARKVTDEVTTQANFSRREGWEASPEGQARMTGVQDKGMGVGMSYMLRGYTEAKQSETNMPRAYDRQLPGMEDPLAAPTPERWDDLDDKKRGDIERRVALKSGATMGSMVKSMGAQIDQSYLRADKNTPAGASEVRPYGQDFYHNEENPDSPRGVVAKSARELGIPYSVHAAMNAFTSPQTKFQEGDRYPNNEAAMHVVRHMEAGGDASTVHRDANYTDPTTGEEKRHSGYPANFEKAGRAHDQWKAGVPMSDWKNESGSSMFGPKTGPYHNSWLRGTPDTFVADVHSGGGGMIPHLGTAKPLMLDSEGNPKPNSSGSGFQREKSEREAGIETKGFHSMADEAHRRAMAQRGLGSVRQTQATQWSEERIQRTEQDARFAFPEDKAYPTPAPKKVDPNQGSMFADEPAPAGPLAAGRTTRAARGKRS